MAMKRLWVLICLLPCLVYGSSKEFDCGIRKLMMEYALRLGLSPPDAQFVHDALQLTTLCGERMVPSTKPRPQPRVLQQQNDCETFLVRGSSSKDSSGGYESLQHALDASRASAASCRRIQLGSGVTFLNHTIELGPLDSGLTITGLDDDTWISGGTLLTVSLKELKQALKRAADKDIVLIQVEAPADLTEVPGLFGLNPHVRFQRARWPNGDTERVQWGYKSPTAEAVSVSASEVREWTKPKAFPKAADMTFIDLSQENNPTGWQKNDSMMDEYNTYAAAQGGVCDEVWDTSYGSSYWCSTKSAGGWAEVDNQFAEAQTVGLPVGLEYYVDSEVGRRIQSWSNATGAMVHAFHGQSWFTNMWEVDSHDKPLGALHFGRGGSQGGRNWCRCDQCTYAGSWCKRDSNGKVNDTRLISGNWYVENVEEELDTAGEFYFDTQNRTMRLLLNKTDVEALVTRHEPLQLVVPRLATLININGANEVTLSDLGFRDARYTYLEKHGVPSGGDWSLYKGAAVMLANTCRSVIQSCKFSRLDGTAVMLVERTRHVVIRNSHFEWLGESAMAAWGHTDAWDGRSGRQPRDTLIEGNVVREIGIYEKQSSAWFQAKACRTTLRENAFFNMPRAAVNFNDGFGGGNIVEDNLMFNTCRESGDHGVINTWDRQPFLWDESGQYGFDTPHTVVQRNFLLANYGASQGVDNDDGSSFYNITDNIHIGDGFKGDYGPHDSSFTNNLVLVLPYDGQNCMNVAPFKEGHQHSFLNNTCVVLGCRSSDCDDLVGRMGNSCSSPGAPLLANNAYFTKHGNATIECAGKEYRLDTLQALYPKLEMGSIFASLPSDAMLIDMVKDKMETWEKRNDHAVEIAWS